MQIHEVVVSDQIHHKIDPIKGLIATHEQVMQKGSTISISDPEFGVFEVEDNGSFLVPEELASKLTAQPDWFYGPNPFPVEDTPAPKRTAKAKA